MPGVGTTHHVKVGDDLLLVRQGSYRKRNAPMFGARFTTGDPDYNNLSFWQHWAQSCWVGGVGAPTWSDDSMFDQGVGVDVAVHEVATLARDLGRPSGEGWGLNSSNLEREFCYFDGYLFVLEKGSAETSFLWRLGTGGNTWTKVKDLSQGARGICSFSGRLWLGDGGGALTFVNPNLSTGTRAKPAGRTETPYCMRVYKGKMYVGFGRYIWRMKGNEDWDGNTVFFDAAGVDNIVAMELHQGFLYMASANGHILRTDGNVTMDLWSWDGGVRPTSMRSYDGKLFVGASETSLDGTATEGTLYQFTGSAVTELKRWGQSGVHTPIGKMRVARRHLFYGAGGLLGAGSGFGVAVYDAIEDAHSVFASNRDESSYSAGTNGVNHIVDDVIVFGDWLIVSVRAHGLFRTKLQFRDTSQFLATFDTTASGASTDSLNGGWFTSSDFDAGTPGLRKLWRRIVVHADVPSAATSVTIDYSLDGGATWVTAGVVSGATGTGRRMEEFYLDNVLGTRLKYRVTLRTTDTTRSPALRGVVVSYLPQGDPNWQWDFIAALAAEVELLDGTTATQDVAGIVARLEAAFRSQELISFTDVDGTVWASSRPGVLMTDYQKDLRYIGPASDGVLEGDVRITLLEAVEQAV